MKQQNEIRSLALQALHHAGSGHPGGSLSCVDILYTLYFHVANINKNNLEDNNRDRITLSKGHAAPALYATLVNKGILPKEQLMQLRQTNCLCEGHPTVKVPGVEATSGPLGLGSSQTLGMALGAKLQNKNYRSYTILGDGECNEGQVWEGAMFATYHKLDNVVAIIDYNKLQSDDYCENISALDPLADKWRAFGWFVVEVDGHNINALKEVFDRCSKIKGKPSVIIAHTVKGKGVSFMENDPLWHGSCAPNAEQLAIAIKELEEA